MRPGWRRLVVAMLAIAVVGGSTMACGLFGGKAGNTAGSKESPDWKALRERMVRDQIEARGVRDPKVLEAMRAVPREKFVPENVQRYAYEDGPLPIEDGQTISQPYIVALMTELLEVGSGDKVLEIGTGSGYQSAVLAAMGVEVFTIEIRPLLCRTARERLRKLGYDSVHVRCGDGYGGWPEAAPFDGIIVTAAPERVPDPLLDQLKVGGHMVIPVGAFYQELKVITRSESGYEERSVVPVRFVPMTGQAERDAQ